MGEPCIRVGGREGERARRARGQFAQEKPLEQLLSSRRLEAGSRLSSHPEVRRFVGRDLEGAARIRSQALRNPCVTVNGSEDLVPFGQKPEG